MNKKKLIIIGAGVSGLYAAILLQDSYDVSVLEARKITGGRVMNVGGHDLGPSWVWGHQKNILTLIETLGLSLMEQYTKGEALYDSPEGVQRFDSPASSPSARIQGGISALVEALEKQVSRPIVLNTKVLSITQKEEKLFVQTDKGSYEADRVISTLPPRLAAQSIHYDPKLPEALQAQFENIPTWMGYSAKCVIEFEDAFWKEEGLSGFAFSHLGPLSEIHDACTENTAALFGFLHSKADLTSFEKDLRAQLIRIYGQQAAEPKNIYLIDWKKEKYTSTFLDALPLREHPNYGFNARHFEGKLLFSGTESSFNEGGYLEGAITAAKHAAKVLL